MGFRSHVPPRGGEPTVPPPGGPPAEPAVVWYRRHWVHLVAVGVLAFSVGSAGSGSPPDGVAVAEAAGAVTSFDGRVAGLEAQLDAALAEKATLGADNDRLATSLDRTEGRLASAQEDARDLRSELRDLRSELRELTEAPAAEPEETEDSADTAAATWTVTNIVDGDTIDVRSGIGVTERVRIIGIDTPERGECGFAEAATALGRIIDGRPVTLTPGARDDRDRYGRILRYVDVGGTDAGLRLIQDGYAIARYDSRDGYGKHTREDAYVTADTATAHRCGVSGSSTAGTSGSGSSGSTSAGSTSGSSSSSSGVVKRSRRDICHAPGTTWYDQTTNFTPYDTLDACLASGGRLPRG
jgi:micrococcal nuclease